jgi:diguanylate cyclase (GGDEF)-like protein
MSDLRAGLQSAANPTADLSLGRSVAALFPRRPAVRIALFTLVLAAVAAGVFATVLAGRSFSLAYGARLPWPLLAVGFLIAELKVVDVHFRREKHSFSLSEFPAVIGLFTLTPWDFLLAVMTGTVIALVWSRQAPIKLVFNLVNFAAAATLTLAIFHVGVDVAHGDRLIVWLVAFAATSASAVLSAVTIATAISLSGGAPQFQKLPEMVQFGGLVAVANTSLALLAVTIIESDVSLIVLLVVPLVTVFLAYRAYLSEREKHERLELLYQSSRILQHSPQLDSAVVALLEHAREMFRAERAQLMLYPRATGDDGLLTSAVAGDPATAMVPTVVADDDPMFTRVGHEPHAFFHVPSLTERTLTGVHQAMVAPLRGESGLIGAITIANRMTEGTSFMDEDLRLLETLANQAAVALENGQLEQSLAELSRLKEQLRYQAYHDPLTGLANRSLLTERVMELLDAPQPGMQAVVLFLDLDNFKLVNDSMGHAAGDRLLTAVADRVRDCVREGDLVARLGGDEFAVLMNDESNLGRAVAVTNRVLESLKLSFHVDGQEISISASIGIAAARADTQRPDELLRNADVAMYTAKEEGKGRFAVFDPTVHAAIVARHVMSSDLGRALAHEELSVLYQPIVALRSGRIVGMEALVRWRHPTLGMIPPEEFISLAEESGTILTLGRYVLEVACAEVTRLNRFAPGPEGLLLTVNLAASQLKQADFVLDLKTLLQSVGLPPHRLALEMTETAMFSDTQTTIARLEALRDLGVRIAVDDFGTGYSSLGYLRRFKVDILKIARDFVASSTAGGDEWAFAHAIVALGRTLGLDIVAEGIEEQGQLEKLRDLGCEFGQGYLFARPTDGASIERMLRESVADTVVGPKALRPAGRRAPVGAVTAL